VILLVSGLTGDWARMYRDLDANVGFLVTPSGGHKPETVLSYCQTWACDNDAFRDFKPDAFRRMLGRWQGRTPPGKFVACPDVVADYQGTRDRFEEWEPEIHASGFPVALVAQDGLTPGTVPWERIEALFIGGTTAFKIGQGAADLCRAAKERGKWVHMGRVNSARRMETAARYGCDSIDGSGYSKWRKLIAPGVRFLRRAVMLAKTQPEMF